MINKNVDVLVFFFLHLSDQSYIFFHLHDSAVNIQTVLENNQQAQWKKFLNSFPFENIFYRVKFEKTLRTYQTLLETNSFTLVFEKFC